MSDGPVHRVISAAEVYSFPQGHLGHLSDVEAHALDEFRTLCTEKNLYTGTKKYDFGSHDDTTLLRFLRARRFNVQDAFQQFKETEEWRAANQLDTLYETIDLQHFEETRRLYPQWTGRRDKRGIPVYIFEVKHLDAKAMAAYDKSASQTHSKAKTDGNTAPKLLRLFTLYENLTRYVMPLSTVMTDRPHPSTPITQSNNIVDISGVGLKQFWNLRSHMQSASQLATAHYPETLDRIFIIGAPYFFPTVWGWIKRWFDPITTSKIFILTQSDMKSTLESFIEPANIPKKYGGELDFNWCDPPVYDPALNDVITWKNGYETLPTGPMYWRDQGDHIELEAVGAVDGKQRRDIVATVRKTAIEREAEEANKTTEEALPANVAEAINASSAGQPKPGSYVVAPEGIATLSLQDDKNYTEANGNVESANEKQDPTPDVAATEEVNKA
ncbi:hypothetical protein V495_03644 [Pseudogymnoascus sp. VKM F-4514 (FW-929)]|nr:hypothetical protein V490_02249 [Pseudogymnoascus sp. VKM F-3557]KFY44100.1 hypothetical protein V495_03644 [Pseudogymnoascus sp. VKM F-4514 (FW-929)]KFY56731.1 hypothetical protein V497_06008 [Pseudogymnoascus sp. VKM F-4516 (FW-969)]